MDVREETRPDEETENHTETRETQASVDAGLLRTVLDHLNLQILVRDVDTGELLFANRHAKHIIADGHLSLNDLFVLRGGYEDPWGGYRRDQLVDQCGNIIRPHDVLEYYHKDVRKWFRSNMAVTEWAHGRKICIESDIDITEEKESSFKLEYLAWHDDLLGLPNRDKFMRDLTEALVDRRRCGAVLLMDLDEFKDINDAFGHDYGDQLMQAMTYYICSFSDLSLSVYRFGGDEMIFLLEGMSDADVNHITERLLNRFREPWFVCGREEYCTVSIGVAKYPEQGATPGELLSNVDIALYHAKRMGKNRAAWYISDLGNDGLITRLETERRMRRAVQNGCCEFVVFYQPIVDLATKRWVGAESLLRWDDPAKGIIDPDEFVPLAEYNGLIVPIGEHLLRNACMQCGEWRRSGVPDFYVSVNISIRQIHTPNLIDCVVRALNDASLPPSALILEITESMATPEMSLMLDQLNKLRELGIRIGMDDFGTGYSSLNNLRKMPLDLVKIDRDFAADVLVDSYHRSFIRFVVELAANAGLAVCTEGIESSAQLGIIEELGSDLGQGYLFSPPLSADEFFDMLLKQKYA